MFYGRDFVRVELRLDYPDQGSPPASWWRCQQWLADMGLMPLSNKAAEYDEVRPLPQDPTSWVWWDCFDGTDQWSWYFPRARRDIAALFKLTFAR